MDQSHDGASHGTATPSAEAHGTGARHPQHDGAVPDNGNAGSSDAFTFLSFGGTFRRTVGLFMDHYDLFGILSAVSLVPYGMFYSTITLFAFAVKLEMDMKPDFHPSHIPLITMVIVVELGLYAVFTLVGRAAMFRAVAQLYVQSSDNPSGSAAVDRGATATFLEPSASGASASPGQRPIPIISWQQCFRESFQKNLVTLLGASLLTTVAMLGIGLLPYLSAILAFVVPNLFTVILATVVCTIGLAYGTYVYVGWILCGPAIVLEQQGHRQATLQSCNCEGAKRGLNRSWELIADNRCYVMCSLFILYLAHTVLRRLMHTLFTTSGSVNDILFTIPGILAEFLPKFIFFPLHSILEVVLYINLRIGRESLNREMLEAELQHGLDDTGSNHGAGGSSWMGNGFIETLSSSLTNGGEEGTQRPGGFAQNFSFRQNVNTDYRQVPLMDGEQPLQQTNRQESGEIAFTPPSLPESSGSGDGVTPQQTFV